MKLLARNGAEFPPEGGRLLIQVVERTQAWAFIFTKDKNIGSWGAIRRSDVKEDYFAGELYWSVQIKFRAKNAFGAYVLAEEIYCIRKNKVLKMKQLLWIFRYVSQIGEACFEQNDSSERSAFTPPDFS